MPFTTVLSAYTLFLFALVPVAEVATTCTDHPCAASLETKVGSTTRGTNTYSVGVDVYGPFESDFGSLQELNTLCGNAQPGIPIYPDFLKAGLDVYTAEQMIAAKCDVKLPRQENGQHVGMLDDCGHQSNGGGFQENMKCLYANVPTGHSPSVAEVDSVYKGVKQKLYGKWEDYTPGTQTYVLPALDACNGHFGVTPDSNNEVIYHYHTTDLPPFTVGCFGPAKFNNKETLVSPTTCRSLYSNTSKGCGGNLVSVTTPTGTRSYDPWCPCWSGLSNVDPNASPIPSPLPSPASPPPSPLPSPPKPDSEVTHNITLYPGWTWMSSPLFSGTISDLLGDMSGSASNNDLVKGNLEFTTYIGGWGWFGNLQAMKPTDLLKARIVNGGTFTLKGTPTPQIGVRTELQKGWTWLGWPSMTEAPVSAFDDALVDIGKLTTQNEKIKSQLSFTSYIPGWGWFGDLQKFEPGKGYMIKLSQKNELVSFGASASAGGRKLDSAHERKLETAQNEAHRFAVGFGQSQLVPEAFEYSMCVVAIAMFDGVVSEDGDLAAFVNGELRGVAHPSTYKMPVGSYKGYKSYNLMIYGQGDTEGATVTFQYRHADGQISMFELTKMFEKNGDMGTIMEPLVIAHTASASPTPSTYTSAPSQSASASETPSVLPATKGSATFAPAGISLSTGTIIGIAAGALFVLILMIALCMRFMTSSRANQKGMSTTVAAAQKVDADVMISSA